MDIKKQYSTDKDLENNGVWVDIGDGAKLLVARINNPHYAEMLRAKTKPYKRQMQAGTMDSELSTDIMMEVYAATILLNWEGVTEGGKDVPYTRETAAKYLRDINDFRGVVLEIASGMEAYRQQDIEDATKN